ncbi:MAG: hypothetical protein RR954_09975 [Christensenellaceae bacterium]
MNLKDLCNGVKPSCPKQKSREKFITGLLTAAGGAPFISDSYKMGLCNGGKPFTVALKAPNRGKDNLQSLMNFFMTEIADAKAGDVLLAFGIPEKETPNKKALSVALAKQMKALIEDDNEDVDEIVILEYQRAKEDDAPEKMDMGMQPLYPGDSAYVQFVPNQTYKIDCYGTVQHTWSIQNTGKIKWIARKLTYARGPKDRAAATPAEIPIPDVEPNEFVRISTTIDGRGFDGITRCIWEMQDSDGKNCFPKRESLFCVTIDAKFKRN